MSMVKICNTCNRVYKSPQDFLVNTSRWRKDTKDNLFFNCSCDSTLVIYKGNYDWYSPEVMLSPKAKDVFNKISIQTTLPTLPCALIEIEEAIVNPNETAEGIGKLLKNEPLLAAEVLKLANLSIVSSNTKIRSLDHAVAYLGTTQLRELIRIAGLRKFDFGTEAYKNSIFWVESLLCGLIAEALQEKVKSEYTANEVYIYCCLANIGKAVSSICLPKSVDEVFALTKSKEIPWAKAEQILGTPSHEILGEIATQLWALPAQISMLAAHHHVNSWAKLPPKDRLLCAICAFSNQATHWILGNPYRIDHEVMKASFEYLKLDGNMNEVIKDLTKLKDEVLKVQEK